MSDTLDTLTDTQRLDLMKKILALTVTALKRTPGGTASLGKVAMSTPDGQQVLALMLVMQSRGEL